MRLIVGRVLRKYPLAMAGFRDDVEQDTLIRLTHVLDQVPVDQTFEFLALAALHVRRAVLDILRREMPRRSESRQTYRLGEPLPGHERVPVARSGVIAEFEVYDLFDRLGTDERRAIDCLHVLGMSQEEMAAEFGVHLRTVRRWYSAAKLRLTDLLGIELDE